MSKTKFFGFDKKKAVSNGVQFIARGAGAVGAAYASNNLIQDKIPPKYHGAGLALIGLAGEMFIQEPHAKALLQGIGTYGSLKLAGQGLQPKVSLGLSGVGDEPVSGIGAFDWKQIADEAERIASQKSASMAGTEDNVSGMDDVAGIEDNVSGMEDNVSGTDENVSGLGATENETAMLLN